MASAISKTSQQFCNTDMPNVLMQIGVKKLETFHEVNLKKPGYETL